MGLASRPDPPTPMDAMDAMDVMDTSSPFQEPSPPTIPSPPQPPSQPEQQLVLYPNPRVQLFASRQPSASKREQTVQADDEFENSKDHKRFCVDDSEAMVVHVDAISETRNEALIASALLLVSEDSLPLQDDPSLWNVAHHSPEREVNFDMNYNKMILPPPDNNSGL